MANDRARKGGCAFSPGWSVAESWVSRMTRVRAGFSRRHMCRPCRTRGMKGTLPRTAPPKSGGLSWAELSRPAVAGRDSRQLSPQAKTSRPWRLTEKPSLTIWRCYASNCKTHLESVARCGEDCYGLRRRLSPVGYVIPADLRSQIRKSSPTHSSASTLRIWRSLL